MNEQLIKAADGVTVLQTHSGQRQLYGDAYYEYEVRSALPVDQVERACRERVYDAIPQKQWQDENSAAPTMTSHLLPYYTFESLGDGQYFYRVTFPYAD